MNNGVTAYLCIGLNHPSFRFQGLLLSPAEEGARARGLEGRQVLEAARQEQRGRQALQGPPQGEGELHPPEGPVPRGAESGESRWLGIWLWTWVGLSLLCGSIFCIKHIGYGSSKLLHQQLCPKNTSAGA